jgi:hypothetical protein
LTKTFQFLFGYAQKENKGMKRELVKKLTKKEEIEEYVEDLM